jgi:hypothetical protein
MAHKSNNFQKRTEVLFIKYAYLHSSAQSGLLTWKMMIEHNAALAQSAERRSRKAKVAGSIPAGGSAIRIYFTSHTRELC